MTAVNSDAVLDLFRRHDALMEGHFRLSSGLHSAGYLQSALVLQHPEHASVIGANLAEHFAAMRPTVVLSPALGGVIIGHEVGRALGVRAIFAERQEGLLTLRRGFEITRVDRVLLIEDVVTTGGSTRETIEVARQAGGEVIGAGAIIDRSPEGPGLDVPFRALAAITLATHDPDSCPLCGQGVPIVKPGSRKA